jgi:hypothetical protein
MTIKFKIFSKGCNPQGENLVYNSERPFDNTEWKGGL